MKTQTTTQDLVFYQNNIIVTSSRLVAEKFNKQHKDVLRAIRNLKLPDDLKRLNFKQSEYIDSKGESQPEFVLTKDGFTFLIFGFTGKDSKIIAAEYLNAFKNTNNTSTIGQSIVSENKYLWAKIAEMEQKQLKYLIELTEPKPAEPAIHINDLEAINQYLSHTSISETRKASLHRVLGCLRAKPQEQDKHTNVRPFLDGAVARLSHLSSPLAHLPQVEHNQFSEPQARQTLPTEA